MKPLRLKKSPLSVKLIIIFFSVFFVVEAVVHIFPMCWALLNSFKTAEEYFADSFAFPQVWRFDNYIRVFTEFKARDYNYLDMLFNSLWMLVVSVFVETVASAILAYPMARFEFPGKNFLYTVIIFANTIPIIGNGPAYFKMLYGLNMIDNPYLIWISWANGFDFAFIVFYGNFKGISQTYSEAAKLDGAGDFYVFLKIILPQAFPCIAAIAIQQAMGVWNNYSRSMIYLRSYPNLAYGLYLFNTESMWIEDSKPIYFSAAVISSIPVILLYASSQKLILTNVTAGGLKG